MKVKFFGEMTKARLDVDPVAGQEVERIINDAVELDAALLGKLKTSFKSKTLRPQPLLPFRTFRACSRPPSFVSG
jgi:hypothetical protein